ncbi:HNH endonuclease [Corynebacterium qintianiae]|uniref:HNH endonuclease n=1 Tax=Corynebacterium qintianiae TaxID=2709392 RepID=A0A7T0KNZ3_9CORY|nr:HNH endonuclease signature motif containing protein [Corynebacterium qintianiae]QPK83328.1 HNH endonuclease [Corynebacterium qintianiae]
MPVCDHPVTPESYFATEREGDPVCDAARLGRESEYAMYSAYATDGSDIADLELFVAACRAASGKSKHEIEKGVLGYFRLQSLPRLRELQQRTLRLDIARLGAIDSALNLLGASVSEETLDKLDRILVRMFTPSKPAQELPSPWAITRRLRERIATIDPSVNFDEKKRRKRAAPDPTQDAAGFFESVIDGVTQHGIELLTNSTTMALIRSQINSLSREEQISHAQAIIGLLTGKVAPRKVVLNVYAPANRATGEPVYIPGFGWTDHASTDAFDDLSQSSDVQTVYLSKDIETESYTPTPQMKAYVHARDGVCVFPGCHRPAENCQLDHRIPFDQGGRTTPDNLFALCQRHHNVKTDRRAFYIPDPVTGDVIWLFDDGTYVISENQGILASELTPLSPHWRSSLSRVQKNKARTTQFYAKCHAVLDQYDRDGDYDRCETSLTTLEREYDRDFDQHPDPPPPEPDSEEPPHPDPIDEGYVSKYSYIEQAMHNALVDAA